MSEKPSSYETKDLLVFHFGSPVTKEDVDKFDQVKNSYLFANEEENAKFLHTFLDTFKDIMGVSFMYLSVDTLLELYEFFADSLESDYS